MRDKETGLMVSPVGKCYKTDAMCVLRERADSEFQCVYNEAACRHKRAIGDKRVTDGVQETE